VHHPRYHQARAIRLLGADIITLGILQALCWVGTVEVGSAPRRTLYNEGIVHRDHSRDMSVSATCHTGSGSKGPA
jgi:hypothetical protein